MEDMLVDLALALLLVVAGVHGWHRGAAVRGFQLAGLLGAGAVAWHWTPRLLHHVDALARPSVLRSVTLVGAVWLVAMAGDLALGRLGLRLMGRRHLSRPDAALGALASVLVTSFVAWFAATATHASLPASVAREVADSRLLGALDAVAPEAPRRWAASLATSIDEDRFPDVFNSLSPDPEPSVSAPTSGVAAVAGVRQAAAGIVKIEASSDACGGSEGSGWVVAPHRVVTNAHVVAGATTIRVQVGGTGHRTRATVVAYDPRTDLAILDAERMQATVLQRATGTLADGTSTAVAGFPLDGGYTVVAARVRNQIEATGRDIYSSGLVTRRIYSLRAVVRPGNSGGPLLTTSGRVAGTVFARSTTSTDTGYALSDAATDALLDRAASLTAPVSTQGCTAD